MQSATKSWSVRTRPTLALGLLQCFGVRRIKCTYSCVIDILHSNSVCEKEVKEGVGPQACHMNECLSKSMCHVLISYASIYLQK